MYHRMKKGDAPDQNEGGKFEDNQSGSKFRGYLTVFGGFSIHLFCGCLYLWGNIQNYVLSYFANI